VLDRRLTFENYVCAVNRSCNYQALAIRHMLSTVDGTCSDTVSCSLINWTTATHYCMECRLAAFARCRESRTKQPGSFYMITSTSPKKISCVAGLKPMPATLCQRHRIGYKLAVLTYKVRALPLQSAGVPLLDKPCTRTEVVKRAFRQSAPSVWNLLPVSVITSEYLAKDILFHFAFDYHTRSV